MATYIRSISSLKCCVCREAFEIVNLEQQKKLGWKEEEKRYDDNIVVEHPCCGEISHLRCFLNNVTLRKSNKKCPSCWENYAPSTEAWIQKLFKERRQHESNVVIKKFEKGMSSPTNWYWAPYTEVVVRSHKYKENYQGFVEESGIGYSKIFYNRRDCDTWEDNDELFAV